MQVYKRDTNGPSVWKMLLVFPMLKLRPEEHFPLEPRRPILTKWNFRRGHRWLHFCPQARDRHGEFLGTSGEGIDLAMRKKSSFHLFILQQGTTWCWCLTTHARGWSTSGKGISSLNTLWDTETQPKQGLWHINAHIAERRNTLLKLVWGFAGKWSSKLMIGVSKQVKNYQRRIEIGFRGKSEDKIKL